MSTTGARITRYVAEPDLGGPRMRLGVIWFLVLIVGHLLGAFTVALLFALVAGVAALQTASAWRRHRVEVNQIVAGAGAAVLPLAAWFGHRTLGAALLAFAVAAVVMGSEIALPRAIPKGDDLNRNLAVASTTLRSGLFFGLAGAAAVATAQIDPMAFVFLASMVCVFDAGDFLVGAGYESHLAGPLGGVAGVVIVGVALGQLPPAPFDAKAAMVVSVVTAGACVAGQLWTSWILPRPRIPAPAARRLDAWLIAAPLVALSATLAS